MASNQFGNIFRITTFGESHGSAVGVVIDGCPAGVEITKEEIDRELSLRSPGKTSYVSPRKESDQVTIVSGIFDHKTTGAPIALLIANQDVDSSKYESIKDLYRPGHANFTYLKKYGIFDYRGGGRASARETVARVAAGAVAKKFLQAFDIQVCSFISQIHTVKIQKQTYAPNLKENVLKNPIFCPDEAAATSMMQLIEQAVLEKDSLGAVVETIATKMPVGLGDPIYNKLEANLAFAMLSIPATKGFEIGAGFQAATMKGSEHNDLFDLDDQMNVTMQSNHAGGTLGGISTGMNLCFRVAFKPTSSIQKEQQTLNFQKEKISFNIASGSRHDPCVAIRAVPVVEAMTAIVLADALLLNRCSTPLVTQS